ncbi:MAG: toll/interleukin-1 receptor domain-containing protein [Promethearchaeota archaeon]
MVKVFFGYTTADTEKFKIPEIARGLEDKPNIEKVFFWGRDSTGSIVRYMEEGITAAHTCVLFYSPEASQSRGIEKERDMAIIAEKHIIPVFMNIDDVPLSLRTKTGISISGKTSKEVAEEIYHHIDKKFGIIVKEEPVMLYFIDDRGMALFSTTFRSRKEIDSQLIAGLLSAIRSFGRELLDQEMDGILFREYTLLISDLTPFIIVYIFKGQPYYARRKVALLLQNIQESTILWQALNESREKTVFLNKDEEGLLKDLVNRIILTTEGETH